jgi:hypothetical protein
MMDNLGVLFVLCGPIDWGSCETVHATKKVEPHKVHPPPKYFNAIFDSAI